jgi:hypothetical protein
MAGLGFEVYHYGKCGMNDCGWGCTYRNIQTVISALACGRGGGLEVPSMDELLGRAGKALCGGGTSRRLWIEPHAAGLILERFGLECENLLFIQEDAVLSRMQSTDIGVYTTDGGVIEHDEDALVERIRGHFRVSGLPVIIDDGTFSYALWFDGKTLFLIDPHTTRQEEVVREVPWSYLSRKFWMVLFCRDCKGVSS